MKRFWDILAAGAAVALLGTAARAGVIEVVVTGLAGDRGVVACSLHREGAGFPDAAGVAVDTVAPRGGQGLCRFPDVAPGRYAVAVMHDVNANGRLDTNILGIPQEPWGISVGPAPRLRAPRFSDAAFRMGEAPLRMQVTLRR